MKSKRSFPLVLGFTLIFTIVSIFVGLCFLINSSWQSLGISNADFTGLGAAMALMTFVSGVLTLIFVFLNYDLQYRQIKENKRDSDYSRALDLIYRQFEITEKKMDAHGIRDKIAIFIGQNNKVGSISLELEHTILEDDFIKSYTQVSHFIVMELEFIYHVLAKSQIEDQDKQELARLIPNNINYNLLDSLIVFRDKVNAYKNTENPHKGFSNYLQHMVDDSDKIKRYLFLN